MFADGELEVGKTYRCFFEFPVEDYDGEGIECRLVEVEILDGKRKLTFEPMGGSND